MFKCDAGCPAWSSYCRVQDGGLHFNEGRLAAMRPSGPPHHGREPQRTAPKVTPPEMAAGLP